MKKFALLALSLPQLCFALEERPWYGELLEFDFLAQYEYNFFTKVDNASPQIDRTHFAHVLGFRLDVTVPETWNWEVELEFADTTDASMGYRSFAIQARKLWLDDVCGDCVSLSSGLVYRDASARLRKDLSTPYHARANFEFHTSIGKEWSCGPCWTFRTYATGAIGQGTQGSPWLRGDLFLWWNLQNCHEFRLYATSYFGLGGKTIVDTDDFKGWSRIGHHSIDLGGSYRYSFGMYGSLRFDYLHRVYARSYPEHVNFFVFTFEFPFSIF